ncbi:hypothetical protein H632_c4240p0, partial [Helicosporidium sp. ATCC 50920]
ASTHCASQETRAPEDEDEHAAQASGTMDVSTLDPETFDDSEFYSFLLKEFIESSGNTDASLYSVPKKRKVVDHRASKGRKLRYHVHQKLVNFMAPVEVEEPAFADQLFSNLFGGEGLTA